CPPVSGHSSLHLLLISSAKQGALPSRSRTEQDAPTLVWLAPGAGGGWPISGRYKEEVEGRMARDRGTWRKSATRRPCPQCARPFRDALKRPSTTIAVMALDPVTLSVLQNGLMKVCNEMDLAF